MVYYASGKLLLFGEYFVLRGAKSLAIPLKYGQQMRVTPSSDDEIGWESRVLDKVWFSARYSRELELIETSDETKSSIILKLLRHIKDHDPEIFSTGYQFRLTADFPMEWGIGSSSTLVSLLAQWSHSDPYELLANSFGGSGYDVTCATATSPIIYELPQHSTTEINLSPGIKSGILFVYSGRKQKTNIEVSRFKSLTISHGQILDMNTIVSSVADCTQVDELEQLMVESESLLSAVLGMKPVQESKFGDYPYRIKSLGAWGGDFFMATYRNEEEARGYFGEKGYDIMFSYDQIIKK